MWRYELLKNKTYLLKEFLIQQIIILFWLPLTHQEYEQAQEGRHGAAIQKGQRDEHGRIQGWEFSLSLIHYSLFRSKLLNIKRATVSDSLSSLSDCHQIAFIALRATENDIAQVTHDKRGTGGICSFSQVNHSFALSLTKN